MENGNRVKKRKDLSIKKCGSDGFDFVDKSEVIRYGINNFTCLQNVDYEMFGNYYKNRMTYLEIKLWKC